MNIEDFKKRLLKLSGIDSEILENMKYYETDEDWKITGTIKAKIERLLEVGRKGQETAAKEVKLIPFSEIQDDILNFWLMNQSDNYSIIGVCKGSAGRAHFEINGETVYLQGGEHAAYMCHAQNMFKIFKTKKDRDADKNYRTVPRDDLDRVFENYEAYFFAIEKGNPIILESDLISSGFDWASAGSSAFCEIRRV
jgi:hypothetical protein